MYIINIIILYHNDLVATYILNTTTKANSPEIN